MSDNNNPSNFVSFADYLGLNDETGQSMLNKTLREQTPDLTPVEMANSQHTYQSRGVGNEADFQASGETARKGLASYGEFLNGMNDPSARRALMEKTYGKGSVSWLDSALAGASGAGRLGQMTSEFGDFKKGVNAAGQAADAEHEQRAAGDKYMKGVNADHTAEENDAFDQKAKAARANEDAVRAARRARGIKAMYGSNPFGGADPNGGYFGAGMFGHASTQGGEYDRLHPNQNGLPGKDERGNPTPVSSHTGQGNYRSPFDFQSNGRESTTTLPWKSGNPKRNKGDETLDVRW